MLEVHAKTYWFAQIRRNFDFLSRKKHNFNWQKSHTKNHNNSFGDSVKKVNQFFNLLESINHSMTSLARAPIVIANVIVGKPSVTLALNHVCDGSGTGNGNGKRVLRST